MNKRQYKAAILGILAIPVFVAQAGNPERQGQAGAAQLTINGFARGSGMGLASGSKVRGAEASFLNVAGLSKSKSTEVIFNRSEWLRGSGIGINNFAISQNLGADRGAIALNVMHFGVAPIERTTEQNPNGGIGTYRVTMMNIGLGFARDFTKNISAGIMGRVVTEGIPDVRATTASFDAGVMYSTAVKNKNKIKGNDLHFGIALKNIGPDLRYRGDGLNYKVNIDGQERTFAARTQGAKLPTFLNIAASYDLRLDKDKDAYFNKLNIAFAYATYAFQANQANIGLEYSLKNFFHLRAGYTFAAGQFTETDAPSAFSGFGAGFSWDMKFGQSNVSLEYSWRHSVIGGTHTYGIKFTLDNEE